MKKNISKKMIVFIIATVIVVAMSAVTLFKLNLFNNGINKQPEVVQNEKIFNKDYTKQKIDMFSDNDTLLNSDNHVDVSLINPNEKKNKIQYTEMTAQTEKNEDYETSKHDNNESSKHDNNDITNITDERLKTQLFEKIYKKLNELDIDILQKKSNQWYNMLSLKEKDIITRFTAGDFYENVKEMRSGKNAAEVGLSDLENALKKFVLTTNVEMYRGVSIDEYNFFLNNKKGIIKEFKSLTLIKSVAEGFGKVFDDTNSDEEIIIYPKNMVIDNQDLTTKEEINEGIEDKKEINAGLEDKKEIKEEEKTKEKIEEQTEKKAEENSATKPESNIIIYKVDSGNRGAYIGGNSVLPYEYEFLLKPNSKYYSNKTEEGLEVHIYG